MPLLLSISKISLEPTKIFVKVVRFIYLQYSKLPIFNKLSHIPLSTFKNALFKKGKGKRRKNVQNLNNNP